MTITEFLSVPKGMSIEEYECLIKKKNKLEKQISKASNDIYDAEEKITDDGVANSSAKMFPAESVVVAMYGMGVT